MEDVFTMKLIFKLNPFHNEIPFRYPGNLASQAENVGCIELPVTGTMKPYRSEIVRPIKAPVTDFFVNNHIVLHFPIISFLHYKYTY